MIDQIIIAVLIKAVDTIVRHRIGHRSYLKRLGKAVKISSHIEKPVKVPALVIIESKVHITQRSPVSDFT